MDNSALPDPWRQAAFYADVPVKRAIAWLIDTVLIAGLIAFLIPFTGFLALFFLGGLYLSVSFLYRWLSLARFSATPGMAVMGIEFRDARGCRFDTATAFVHTLAYSLSVAFVFPQVISMALMAFSRRGQGLTDHVLGTAAINRVGWY